MIGIGSSNANIHIYIENTPPLPQYQALTSVTPLSPGDIANIAALTGNHWRKIFNVLAKLAFELTSEDHKTWQNLREQSLLQTNSNYCLYFSAPTTSQLSKPGIHIIMGKTYATLLNLHQSAHWLTPFFAINEQKKLIICPYFDYRQLSNIKITQLVGLINNLESNAQYSN